MRCRIPITRSKAAISHSIYYALLRYTMQLINTLPTHDVLKRHNVRVLGTGSSTLLLCNGYGCSQQVWNYLIPTLAAQNRLVLFDQMGAGQSDTTAYEAQKYATLHGYVQDIVAICQALDLRQLTIIGHSEGAMVALLATIQAPHYFSKAVLLTASPCHVNKPGYYGGFEEQDIQEMLTAMDKNYRQWATTFALLLMGQCQPVALSHELATHFCEIDAVMAKQATRISFLSDHRADLAHVSVPTLLLQCQDDVAVPSEVNDYMVAHLPYARLVMLEASGHCPHLSAPLEVLAALQEFI